MNYVRRSAMAIFLLLLFFPFISRAQDTDTDGVIDRNDNCPTVSNPAQADFEWKSQSGTAIVFDDTLSIWPWAVVPGLTGATVHDGNTAMVINDNDQFNTSSPPIGVSGPLRYLRFWIFLNSASADLALQMNCTDGEGWDHKWGFSGDGIWSGVTGWSFDGFDYNLPVGQWVPIMIDIQGAFSCNNGSNVEGIGWTVKAGAVAFVDSAAFYAAVPPGDACDDSDGDGLLDAAEINTWLTNPLIPDTDGDGLNDGQEVNTTLTDPLLFDTDGDGLNDGMEVNSTLTSPLLADSDGDGMPDGWEVANTHCGINPLLGDSVADADGDSLDNLREFQHLTDPCANDTDSDGLSDVYEIYTSLTDPTLADTDDDGLSDGYEVNASLTNPLIADTDGDGLDDGFEVDIALSNPLTANSDSDGLTDYEEVMLYGTDPNDPDMDGDGVIDFDEIMFHTNPWLIDTDGDGLSDWTETVITGTDPTMPDTNANGVADNYETGTTNTDRDGDLMPTAWENQYACVNGNTADASADPDSDGLANLDEYVAGTDPCNNNTDSDGLLDGEEVNNTGTDPLLSDTDGDSLIDGAETDTGIFVNRDDSGTDPLLSDTDGDGFSDGNEADNDSDPNDPASVPSARGPEQLINYQGRLTDDAGQPVNGAVPMTFGIYAGDTTAVPMWTESQSVTVTQGIYNVLLGSVNPINPDIFPSVQSPKFFLQVTVNGQALTPRSRIGAVPMAMFAGQLYEGRIEMEARRQFVSLNATSVSAHVSFKQTFMQPPQVIASSLGGAVEGISFVSNVTVSGFDIKFKSIVGSGEGTFTYLAFGH